MQNIDKAVEPEEGGKLAHGSIQPASQCAPRRAEKPSRLIEPQGCSAGAALAGAKQSFFFTEGQIINARVIVVVASSELKFELTQTQLAQKPMLRAEVYARKLRASEVYWSFESSRVG
jgi:hypothetical protein